MPSDGKLDSSWQHSLFTMVPTPGDPSLVTNQLVVDATLIGRLGRDGQPCAPGHHPVPGSPPQTSPNLPSAGPGTPLVVFRIEVGGMWAPEATDFVRLLARACSGEVILTASFATSCDMQGHAGFFWRGVLELVLVTD